uniref:Uncharacterized protein n=1 Tax=Sphaerodactylus townsendi TaxID=933632 RepID=A0ACB8GC23_9SAUR
MHTDVLMDQEFVWIAKETQLETTVKNVQMVISRMLPQDGLPSANLVLVHYHWLPISQEKASDFLSQPQQ